MSTTLHFSWSLKLPNFFFSEGVKVPATMGFDGRELAVRWSIVAQLRNPGFSWDGGSYEANRNVSGDVQGLVAQIKLPVNAGGDVCARVAGGELEAAAKTVTMPTSPTEVQAMFVGFDDEQPQVHEVGSSTESEVHITSMKCSCERCKMSSLSAAPSSSEFCGSKLLLASLEPPPISHASETCCDTWETAIASLEPPPIPSASKGWSRSKSKETSCDWHCAEKASCAVPDDSRGAQSW